MVAVTEPFDFTQEEYEAALEERRKALIANLPNFQWRIGRSWTRFGWEFGAMWGLRKDAREGEFVYRHAAGIFIPEIWWPRIYLPRWNTWWY